ncbi:MAG: MFS transporter [Micromonosporaceae bacterium]
MTETRRLPRAQVAPLVLATMTSQALLVVLGPTMAAIGQDFQAPVAAVGQARTVTATAAIAVSAFITVRGVRPRRLVQAGSTVALGGCAAVAAAPGLPYFLVAHGVVGVAVACLLTAGFAGVAAFGGYERARVIGYVTGANAFAWIVVNPSVGVVTEYVSWQAAQAVVAVLALATLVSSGTAAPGGGAQQALPLRVLLGDRSARRWVVAELLAYTCWTGLLTFIGAYFVERLRLGEGAAGWLLASGAAAYVVASTRSARLVSRISRRHLVAGAALVMAVLLPAALAADVLGWYVVALLYCLIGTAAGVRTPASSGLGIDQLPRQAGAMMAVRTGVTQLGYLLGAVAGGAVIAVGGYTVLGGVLGAGMAVSALLVLAVRDTAPE